MAKKIITVFGATGAQGGSVVNTFITDPKLKDEWQVRGVTRSVDGGRAKALSEKGVEMVSGSMDDKESLVKAMTGADAVYALTDYWKTMDDKLEIQQGKNLADAAKEANVGLYIYSTLKHVKNLSGGKLSKVYHFDSKAEIADYVRSIGIPAAFFLPGFYMSNLSSGSMMRQLPPDNAWTLTLPVPPTAPVALLDTSADTGKFIKAMVLHRDEVLGKEVLGSSGYVTLNEVLETFKRLYPEAGRTARYHEASKEEYVGALTANHMPEFAAEELYENMRLLHEFGYYFGDDLAWSHGLVEDKLTSWEDHARHAKEWASLK